MSHTFGDSGVVLDTPDDINRARLIALAGALWLETRGMHRRGRSVYSIVKSEFNLTGNKLTVYRKFVTMHGLRSMERP